MYCPFDKNGNYGRGGDVASNNTLLMVAAEKGLTSVVRIMLDHEANPNKCGGSYTSPLGAAADSGRIDTVELLLSKGGDPNILDGQLGTPLIRAASNGHTQMCVMLIESGADTSWIHPIGGDDAEGLARQCGHSDTADAIANASAAREPVRRITGEEDRLELREPFGSDF